MIAKHTGIPTIRQLGHRRHDQNRRFRRLRVDAIVVEVVRAGVVEARHLVHAVAVSNREIVHSGGRSRPRRLLPELQADPGAPGCVRAPTSTTRRSRSLPPRHRTGPTSWSRSQLSRRRMRRRTISSAGPSRRIEHNCSGKHAAMLLLCRERGWPAEGYRLESHPCQQELLVEVAGAADVEPSSIPTGVDGCGVVTRFDARANGARVRADRAARRRPARGGGDASEAGARAW